MKAGGSGRQRPRAGDSGLATASRAPVRSCPGEDGTARGHATPCLSARNLPAGTHHLATATKNGAHTVSARAPTEAASIAERLYIMPSVFGSQVDMIGT